MLNVGRLSPGAADYYLGEVASSAEDYYTGRGERPGRWVGTLAADVGLDGPVAPEHFRAVLDGRDPFSSERLTTARNDRCRHHSGGGQGGLFDGDRLDVARTASRLRVTVGRIRQLLWAGARQPDERPVTHLVGERVARGGGTGGQRWLIERSEVERFEAAHRARKARPGYDVTLRPPKSVSVVWALAPAPVRDQVRQAHAAAVDAVVAYLEGHALYARRWNPDGGQDRVATDGLIAAAFDHRTSRAGDPLLHTHVVVANLTRTVEGDWRAVDGRPLFDHARPAGLLYKAHLRHELTARLGVAWGQVRNGSAEIDGVPREVIRVFSKRREEIEEMVAESGYTSARAYQAATLATRSAKDHGADPDQLRARWETEAAALGFGPGQLAAVLHRATPDANVEVDEEDLFARLAGPEGLTRQASTFTRRAVVEALSEAVPASVDATSIDRYTDRFLASEHVCPLGPDGDEWVWRRGGAKERDIDLARWSTPDLVRLEADLHTLTTTPTRGARVPEPVVVETVLANAPGLSDEQARMVRALTDPTAPVIQPVSGCPGSGKTYATAAYVETLTTAGVPVVGCALSASAAAELEAACGFGPLTGVEASTVARLLYRLDRNPLAPGTVVVADEASMIGTRDLHRLATHVTAAGGALKLIGDPLQHGAVDAGGFFRAACRHAGDDLITLVGNNRQTDPVDRVAISEFRGGMVETALARYDTAGRVVRAATAAAAYDTMAADWYDLAVCGGTDPMIAGPNRVRRQLNERARDAMRTGGHLTGPAHTTAEGAEFKAGDWVVARRNNPRLTNSAGGWVKNGSAGHVTNVDPHRRSVTVAFDREGTITLPGGYLDDGHLEHGYARTTYGVQGATLDRALYFAGDESSFEEGYVALTRGRTETRIYLVDGTAAVDDDTTHRAHDVAATGLDTVAQALRRNRANTLAHDTDPDAAATAEFAHATLAQLRAERLRLEAVLATDPADTTVALTAAHAERDRLLTRARLHPGTRNVERGLQRVDRRVAALTDGHVAHAAFDADHTAEAGRYRLIRRAELARELHVRADAAATLTSVDEPTAGSPIDRRALLDAAEAVAVHTDRHGTLPLPDDPTTDIEAVLGARPAGVAARLSYERTAEQLVAAHHHITRPARTPAQRFAEVDTPSLEL